MAGMKRIVLSAVLAAGVHIAVLLWMPGPDIRTSAEKIKSSPIAVSLGFRSAAPGKPAPKEKKEPVEPVIKPEEKVKKKAPSPKAKTPENPAKKIQNPKPLPKPKKKQVNKPAVNPVKKPEKKTVRKVKTPRPTPSPVEKTAVQKPASAKTDPKPVPVSRPEPAPIKKEVVEKPEPPAPPVPLDEKEPDQIKTDQKVTDVEKKPDSPPIKEDPVPEEKTPEQKPASNLAAAPVSADKPSKGIKPVSRTENQSKKIEYALPMHDKNRYPSYPPKAKRRGHQGVVQLSVLISETGSVTQLKLMESSGHDSLDRQAMKAVEKWEFLPGKINGIPSSMWVKIPVKFKLR